MIPVFDKISGDHKDTDFYKVDVGAAQEIARDVGLRIVHILFDLFLHRG
jgi:hypothetical protein